MPMTRMSAGHFWYVALNHQRRGGCLFGEAAPATLKRNEELLIVRAQMALLSRLNCKKPTAIQKISQSAPLQDESAGACLPGRPSVTRVAIV